MWIQGDNLFMTYFIEDLIHHSLIQCNESFENEIMSIVKRHNLLEQNFIRKQDTIKYIKSVTQFTYIPNPFFENDKLGIPLFRLSHCVAPTEENIGQEIKGVLLTLQDFGLGAENIVYVDDDQSAEFEEAFNEFKELGITGIDTEFIAAPTTFDKSNEISTIQIATMRNIYIFDGIALKKSEIFKKRLQDYMEDPKVMKVGLFLRFLLPARVFLPGGHCLHATDFQHDARGRIAK